MRDVTWIRPGWTFPARGMRIEAWIRHGFGITFPPGPGRPPVSACLPGSYLAEHSMANTANENRSHWLRVV
jgi:hypothetical protein